MSDWTETDARAAYGQAGDNRPDADEYAPIIDSLAPAVVVRVDDDDYSGDTRVLLRDGERWGFVVIGWGSCSGCDALQSATTFGEIAELRNRIAGEVEWRESDVAMLEYLQGKDWDASHFGRGDEIAAFREQARTALIPF